MPLGSLERAAGYARQRGVRDPDTVALTSAQQRRIRKKMRHAMPSAGHRERRTALAAARAAWMAARRARRGGL